MSEPAVATASPLDAETGAGAGWISRPSPRAIVATLAIVAAILRLLYLGRQGLWLDEVSSVAFTRMSWPSMLFAMPHDQIASPYLIILRLWVTLFGDSEAAVRMPSVIFSVATLPPLYALAKRLAGTRVAIATAILFTVNVFSIRYAQEARCYSLMLLLVTGSWIFFLRCLDAPSLSNYAGYVATSVLGAYTHIFSSLSYLAQWIPVALRSRRIKPRFGVVASVVLGCVLILPKGLSVILTDVGQENWVPALTPASILALLCGFSGSLTTGRGEFLLTSIYLIAAGCSALILIFDPPQFQRLGDRRWFILLGFAFPIMVVLIVSTVKPLLVTRYLIDTLPFLMILCAVGLCRARPRWIGAAGLAAITVLSLYQDYLYYRHYERDDWRAVTAYILANEKPGDAVLLVFAEDRCPYDYYLKKSGSVAPPPIIYPDWDSEYRVDGVDWARALDPKAFEPSVMRVIDDAPKRYTRIWLVLSSTLVLEDSNHRPALDRLMEAMDKQYPSHSKREFPNYLRVLLFDRAANASPP